MIYEFRGTRPVVDPSAFVHPLAAVIGDVVIGREVYIGPGAALRGDWGAIRIGDGCNVQENCVIHAFPGVTVVLEDAAHMGHGSIVHGARIGANALIGMNAVIMDHAVIGAGAIVGALSLVREGMQVPERMIAVGNPARVVKPVSDEMLEWKSEGTRLYQQLPAELHATLREVEPHRPPDRQSAVPPDGPPDRPSASPPYQTWQQRKSRND